MYKITVLFLFAFASLPSMAQDHWLVPQRFFYSIREMAYIRMDSLQKRIASSEELPVNPIKTFLHYRPDGTIRSIEDLLPDPNRDSIALPLQEAGTHMIVLQESREPVTLLQDSLVKWLASEDITGNLPNGANGISPKKEISIRVQESLKTLLQVSEVLTNACTQPSKLLLDIIPEENPNAVPRPGWKEGPVMERFRILFKGKPLARAWVKVTYQIPGKGWQSIRLQTDKRGRIVAERHPGVYRISCAYWQASEKDPANALDYYWGSLNFAYSQYFR
ncbi:MAG: DUF4198 domain-containing protein [Bacteroidota bacterium]|nr:DUF4198 domain-containing protein [Bacteroidota bacterium]